MYLYHIVIFAKVLFSFRAKLVNLHKQKRY